MTSRERKRRLKKRLAKARRDLSICPACRKPGTLVYKSGTQNVLICKLCGWNNEAEMRRIGAILRA
jgi:transcription elongation factor Elf1